jgi:hypothetical protein
VSVNTDVISPLPVQWTAVNFLCRNVAPGFSRDEIAALLGVLEVVPYNTPVRRGKYEFRVVRDQHGTAVLTRGGHIFATGHLGESNG